MSAQKEGASCSEFTARQVLYSQLSLKLDDSESALEKAERTITVQSSQLQALQEEQDTLIVARNKADSFAQQFKDQFLQLRNLIDEKDDLIRDTGDRVRGAESLAADSQELLVLERSHRQEAEIARVTFGLFIFIGKNTDKI